MNFRGRSSRNLDPKGRLMLSPEYRESLYLRMAYSTKNTLNPLCADQKASPINPDTEAKTQAGFQSTSVTESLSTALSTPITENLDKNSDEILGEVLKESQENNEAISNTPNEVQKELVQETKLVVTTYDNCLAVFPLSDWLKLEEQFSRISNASAKIRSFRRLFIGGAEELSIDSQGRIRLSSDHRQYAKLEKEVIVMGLITRFEIWNPALLKASLESQSLDDVAEELTASGIDFAL